MANLKDLLPSKIYETIQKYGICTPHQIIVSSTWDLMKLTNLCYDDITLLKNTVADCAKPLCITGDTLMKKEVCCHKLTTGCIKINDILRGGFRRGTITEIYGESGSGKTQLCVQAVAYNWSNGCVYICTEDMFPIKRFEQIMMKTPHFNPKIDYGNNVFIEHITESHDLLPCIKIRLPKLLEQNNVSLIVIDSIAAPFRFESTNYIQRAEELREIAIFLIALAQKHNLAVICINQVTAAFGQACDVVPSLGLAWSNMVSTRLWLRKCINTDSKTDTNPCGQIRELSIMFAPDLPNSKISLIITPNGIHSK